MPKTISDETVEALVEVLDVVWDDGKANIVEVYQEADDAVRAWTEGEGEVFSGVVGDVLTAWEEICAQVSAG